MGLSGPAHLPLNTQRTLLTGSQPQQLQWEAGVATLTSLKPGLLGFLCLGYGLAITGVMAHFK